MKQKQMGKYCKAYPVAALKQFGGWTDTLETPVDNSNGEGSEKTEIALDGRHYLFLQEDFTVTKNIFLNEDVVFSDVTPEWMSFCKGTLKFEIPALENEAVEAKR